MNKLLVLPLSTLVLMLKHHNLCLQWYALQNNYQGRMRRWWVRSVNQPKRRHGFQHNLYRELMNTDYEEFYAAVRMRPPQFARLVTLVSPYLKKRSAREPLAVSTRLAVPLSYLALGDSVRSKHLEFRIGLSTAHKIIPETCRAIWRALQPLYLPEMQQKDWEAVSEGFTKKWQFPNCIGAIDGRHMRIKKPNKSGSVWYNYKHFFSMVLMATCGANYKFTWVEVGQFGSISDGGVWSNTDLASDLDAGRVPLPPPKPLPHCTLPFPHVLVGDEAFPLKSYLMRPYPRRRPLTNDERVFNYRLSRARRIIENTFGILTARWQILHKPLSCSVDNAEAIFRALTCLHNFLMDGRESSSTLYCPANLVDTTDDENGEWRVIGTENHFRNLGRVGGNRGGRVPEGMRNYLRDYFVSRVGESQAPWQYEGALL